MVKNVPAMGWNSWNTFGGRINEQVILDAAKTLVDSGLKDAGYDYVVIDDCWSLRERDADGRLVADPEKFPHGMKYVADRIHELGLKFGMYSCAGTVTCAGYPGSYEHEFTDAATFAAWDVDYLKYDYCFRSIGMPGHLLYKRMGVALANCGRDILFSNCSWGADDTHIWTNETGANSFRSTGDIMDSWVSIKNIAQSQLKRQEYNGVGCFNDMDMLVVGMRGAGNVGRGGCTDDEYFLHFALWCLCASPLMIGCDITKMDDAAKAILTNPDLIRINQDSKGAHPFFVNARLQKNMTPTVANPYYYENYPLDAPVLARFLDDGRIAVGFFNFMDDTSSHWSSNFNLESLGIPQASGKSIRMKDVRTGEVVLPKNGYIGLDIPAHSARVFLCEVVDA